MKASDETKQKLSNSHKGLSLGHIMSEEQKQKLRVARTGKKHTEESKEKISKLSKGRWLGKKHTEETKQKLREINLGKKRKN
jgi:hypothetical protein